MWHRAKFLNILFLMSKNQSLHINVIKISTTLGTLVSICKRQSYLPKQDTRHLWNNLEMKKLNIFSLDERQDLWGFISLTFLIWPILSWQVLLKDSLLITTNFIATYFFNKIELIKKFICYVKFHNTVMQITKISICNELCKFLVSGIALLRNSYPDVYVR